MTDDYLKEHFPYLQRGLHGEFVIPAASVEDFVRKYLILLDDEEHMERLRLYRAQGQRQAVDDLDD